MASRIVLVTGAANGIGLAVARSFLESGYFVALVDRDAEALQRVAPELPRERALLLTADLRDAEAPDRLAREVAGKWGAASILVNNAGIPSSKRQGLAAGLLQLTDEEWSQVLDVNLGAAFRMCRAFVPGMLAQGWGRV